MKKLGLIIFIILFSIVVFSQNSTPVLKIKKGYYIFVKNANSRKKVIPEEFYFANDFSEGFALIIDNFKFGFINKLGGIVIPCQYKDAGDFSDSLAYFLDDSLYGYIDKSGTVIIEPQFLKAYDFKNGIAAIMINNPDTLIYKKRKNVYGFIKRDGSLLINKYFTDIRHFQDSIAAVWVNKKQYMLSIYGELTEHIDEKNKGIKLIEEIKPEFLGGDIALLNFISSNTNYPNLAKENGIQGKSYISFTVSKTGEVIDERIEISNSHPILNKEALRVIKALPNFKPGYQENKAVDVRFQVPINFTLY